MKIKLLVLLVSLPVISFGKSSQICAPTVSSHPEMIDCIQSKTKKIEDSIKEIITKSGKKYSIDLSFYNLQRKSISERCALYFSMEGQRTDLLESQCEYDGVMQLDVFIKNYTQTVDNY